MSDHGSISVLAAIRQQILDARRAYREPLWIRVSADCPPGSVSELSIEPERLRVHFARLAEDPKDPTRGLLVADPEALEKYREIVLHPEDWYALLRDEARSELFVTVSTATEVTHVFGLPVREAP